MARKRPRAVTTGTSLVFAATVALGLAAAILSCGGDSSLDAEFADGLTAEEILEHAEGPLWFPEPGQSFRTRTVERGEDVEFDLIESTVTRDDHQYDVFFKDGTQAFESLVYDGKSYIRRDGNRWERLPGLDSDMFSRALEVLMGEDLEEFDFESLIVDLSRLSDDEIDGRRVTRVRMEMAAGPDGTVPFADPDGLDRLAKEFGIDRDELPDDILPDEVHMTIVFWVAADDYIVLRTETESVQYLNGEKIMDVCETTDLLEYGEDVVLPVSPPED